MIIDWLYRTSIEVSILIALVLLLRPIVIKTLGANVAYWLWLLPLIRVLMPDRLVRSATVLEAVGVPAEKVSTEFIPTPSLNYEAAAALEFPWELIWIAGAVAWLTLRLITWWQFHRIVRMTGTPTKLSVELLESVMKKVGSLPSRLLFYTCDHPNTPFVIGLLRPKILLPREFQDRFNLEEQRWMLVHELSHIRRRDLWVQLLGELVRAVFWFNPLVHIAVLLLREDQELACDHGILSRGTEQDRYHYGKALLSGSYRQGYSPLLSFFGKNKRRFTMLSKHKASKLNAVLGIMLCTAVSVVTLTKAPLSAAYSGFLSDELVTLSLKSIHLRDALKLYMEFQSTEKNPPPNILDLTVFNHHLIEDGPVISIQQTEVPANIVLERLLKCGGFGFIEYESGIELVVEMKFDGNPTCTINEEGVVEVRSDTVTVYNPETQQTMQMQGDMKVITPPDGQLYIEGREARMRVGR